MSVRKQALKYTAAALAVAAIIIVSSTVYLGSQVNSGFGSGAPSKLVIQLTDPPVVPRGTSSLNLTYSSVALLVGEPATGGMQTTKTVVVGTSGTLNLMKLQNISQTIALTSLPNGTAVYSFAFTVSSISVDINGTKSPVTLATGGDTLTVTLAKPSTIEGTDIALLQLNPVVVSTPGGYQMIPSAVGIVRSEGQGEQNQEQIGSQQSLTSGDAHQLEQAQGNVTATLTELSVSGNDTTVTVQVRNSGNSSVVLNAIGIHGNFTVSGVACNSAGSESGTHTQTQSGDAETNTQTEGGDRTTTTATTSTTSSARGECEMEHVNEVVFVPTSASVTGTSCVPVDMGLVNGASAEGGNQSHGLTLAKGQCVTLTFSGQMSFGESRAVLVPSTSAGQVYGVHVIASEGANLYLSCQLPVTSSSCSVAHQQDS